MDGWKVYMDSYVGSDRLCFVVTWIVFKDHLLEVSVIQIREAMV